MGNILTNGYPSLEEIKQANGWPSEERFAKGPVAICECVQQIPCNPCEGACIFGAIKVGSPITNCPHIEEEKCTGCGNCIAACSGLAIFVVDKTYSEKEATVSFPFEYYPLPENGDTVQALNRAGEYVCEGTVIRVNCAKKNDHTAVVTIVIPKEAADEVRTMKRNGVSAVPVSSMAAEVRESVPDDILICRCEEITAGEIRRAIRENDAVTMDSVKKVVRCGMGLCQGRICSKMVMRILSEETGKKPDEIAPGKPRTPVRPIALTELAGGDRDE